MSSLNIDNVTSTSKYESFKNRQKPKASIILSGSIPGGSSKSFSTDIAIDRDKSIYEIYNRMSGGSYSRKTQQSNQLIDVSWTHNVFVWISNPSSGILRITIEVDNPGSTATITTQTVEFTVYVFDAPFA